MSRDAADDAHSVPMALMPVRELTAILTTQANVLAEQQLFQREPWRAQMQRLCSIGTVACDISLERRKREFEDAAKAHTLSPDDAMAGMYALYGTEKSLALFSTLLLRPPTERVRIHNAYVASCHGSEFVALHGEAILALQWPLFPATEAFSTLNRILLNEAAAATGGNPRRPSVYAREPENDPRSRLNAGGNPTGGAPWVRVVRGDDG